MHANLHGRELSGNVLPEPRPDLSSLSGAAGRPQRIALLNLMPDKPATERHFAGAFAAAARPVEWVLTLPDGYHAHMARPPAPQSAYRTWGTLDPAELDGLIVTGAPLEHLAYREVRYWDGLTRVFEDARALGLPCLTICWAAQAALYHFHGVAKRILPEKCFGIFEQEVLAPECPLFAGLGRRFYTPVSRHSEVRRQDLPCGQGIEVLAESKDSGLCLLNEPAARSFYMFNHLEYETDTLVHEYTRDRAMGRVVAAPRSFLPRRLPGLTPLDLWSGTAHSFFANWAQSLESNRINIDQSTYS